MKPVLLIEDHADFREALLLLFESDEYRFFEAASPTEGILVLEENPQIHVILLDLSFPGDVSATAVLDYVRKRPEHYRVIVLTAHEDLLPVEQALVYRPFHYLPKSDHFSALRFSLDQAFQSLETATMTRKMKSQQEVQKRINENRAVEGTLDLICESVRSIVGAYTCHIRVYDFGRGDFHLMGFAPDGRLRQIFKEPRAKGELFSGRVVETGIPECCDDLQRNHEFRAFKRKALARHSASIDARDYWDTVASAYIVPIFTSIFGPTVDAVLNVSSRSTRFFDSEKQALVHEFVDQASLVITKDWLQRKRDEIHQDYGHISAMLSDMRDRLAGPDGLPSMYSTVTERLSALVNAEVVSIFLYNERTSRIENVAEYRGNRLVDAPDEWYEVGKSYVGKVFESGETLQRQSAPGKPLEKDPELEHATTKRYAAIIPSGTLHHYLGVPIMAGGKIQGVLRAMNKKSEYYDEAMRSRTEGTGNGRGSPAHARSCLLERGFSLDCRNVVEITASHLSIAIQNADLVQEQRRRVEQLQTLGEVGRIISSEFHIEAVLKQTIEAMAVVMEAEICMLFLRSDGEDRIVLRQCYGIPEREIEGATYAIGERVTGGVASTGVAVLIEKATDNDGKYDRQIRRYLTKRDGRRREIESLMVVPIVAKSTLLGVLKVINKVGDDPHYQAADLELFETFGRYVGVAIENAQIYTLTNDRLSIAERDAALSDLVRAVAHEINNTSGLIPANVAAVRKELGAASESVEEMLSVIDDVANQATEFANEITGFSAARRGERRELDVNAVIKSTLRELDEDRYAARLTKVLTEDPLVCVLYETPFKQIVRNIVINAFQALEERNDGVVTISTSRGTGPLAGLAVVQFRDNGPGIRPDHLERIFEVDFTTKPSGNGIGLWLVRKQLDLIGGTIEVASTLGDGALFTVKLPLVSPVDGQARA